MAQQNSPLSISAGHHVEIRQIDPSVHIALLSNENAQLKQIILTLQQENANLKVEVGTLTKTATENFVQQEKLRKLEEQNVLLELQLSLKEDEMVTLRRQNEILREELEVLRKEQEVWTQERDSLRRRMAALEQRDNPITIREAMRILERHICLEVAGTTSAFKRKGLNCIDRIENGSDAARKAQLSSVLMARGLTSDHIDYLRFLKEVGNSKAHAERPALTQAEWEELMQASVNLEEDTGERETLRELGVDLLNALSYYQPRPVLVDQPWCLTDPVESPVPSTVAPSPGSHAMLCDA